jgi:hypothetical protein
MDEVEKRGGMPGLCGERGTLIFKITSRFQFTIACAKVYFLPVVLPFN